MLPYSRLAGRRDLVGLERFVGRRLDLQQLDGIPPQHGCMTQHGAAALLLEQDTVMDVVCRDQAAVASEIDIDDLNVGLPAG